MRVVLYIILIIYYRHSVVERLRLNKNMQENINVNKKHRTIRMLQSQLLDSLTYGSMGGARNLFSLYPIV